MSEPRPLRADEVRRMAALLPHGLRRTMGLSMLYDDVGVGHGVAEVECPGCSGTGWLDLAALEACPVCHAQRVVPQGVAAWWELNCYRIWVGLKPIASPGSWWHCRPCGLLGELPPIRYRRPPGARSDHSKEPA